MSGAEEAQLSFLGRALPLAFRRRTTVWPARSWRAYRALEWSDALVVVERGEIELRCDRGGAYQLGQGTVGHLADVSLVLVGNPGPDVAVVVAISRARPARPVGPECLQAPPASVVGPVSPGRGGGHRPAPRRDGRR